MIGPFRLAPDGYRAQLGEEHNRLLHQLVDEVLVVLDEPGDVTSMVRATVGFESARPEPEDPTLDNLLPPMSDDPPEAARLRALTEDFLRGEKSARLRRLARDLQAADAARSAFLEVRRAEAWDWLAALNDVRLALAGELGIRTDEDADAVWDEAEACGPEVRGAAGPGPGPGPDAGPEPLPGRDGGRVPGRRALCALYLLVTWWQDSLLRAVQADRGGH